MQSYTETLAAIRSLPNQLKVTLAADLLKMIPKDEFGKLNIRDFLEALKSQRAPLNIEIRVKEYPGEKLSRSEELWINGKWHVTYPNVIDGNQVAHSIALILRNEYGIDATYELVLQTNGKATINSQTQSPGS